jgi:hypothetical protein
MSTKLKNKDIESPFGDVQVEDLIRLPKSARKKAIVKAKLIKLANKKKEKSEVVYLPEKITSDTPKRSKLTRLPKEAENIKSKLDNIIKVPKDQLDTFMKSFNTSSKFISSEFLKNIAPVFLSFEDAMNYSTVALRDGLSYDGEIDLELMPILEWAARLATLDVFMSKLKMTESLKTRFLNLCVNRIVEKAFTIKYTPSYSVRGSDTKIAGIVKSLDTTKRNKTQDNSRQSNTVNNKQQQQYYQPPQQQQQTTKHDFSILPNSPGFILKKKKL